MSYRLWVNEERTYLFRLWEDGTAEVATRESPAHTWGPPLSMAEESTTAKALQSLAASAPSGSAEA